MGQSMMYEWEYVIIGLRHVRPPRDVRRVTSQSGISYNWNIKDYFCFWYVVYITIHFGREAWCREGGGTRLYCTAVCCWERRWCLLFFSFFWLLLSKSGWLFSLLITWWGYSRLLWKALNSSRWRLPPSPETSTEAGSLDPLRNWLLCVYFTHYVNVHVVKWKIATILHNHQ